MIACHLRNPQLLRLVPIIAAVVAVFAAAPWTDGAHADAQSSIGVIAVDAKSAGNTATSLGPTDTCVRIEPGATVTVDVVANAIPSDHPMIGFQFDLLYDPAIVNVTANNLQMLVAANEPFTPAVGTNDPVPDSDGDFLVAVVDSGPRETGPGVLSRITLKAKGSGVSTLSLTAIQVRDERNEKIPIDALAAAYLAVGQGCPSQTPPVTTPSGTQPTPGANSDQEPNDSTSPGADTPTTATPGPGTPGAADTPTTLPGTGDTPTPGDGTPPSEETPGASGSPGASGTPAAGGDGIDSGDDSDGGGIGVWIVAPIAAGVLALLAAGYVAFRRIRGRAT